MCGGQLNDEIAISLARSAKSLQGIYTNKKEIKLSNSASYLKMLLGCHSLFYNGIYYTQVQLQIQCTCQCHSPGP